MLFGKNDKKDSVKIKGYSSYEICRDYNGHKTKIIFDKVAVVENNSTDEVADKILLDELANNIFFAVRSCHSKYIEMPNVISISYNNKTDINVTDTRNSDEKLLNSTLLKPKEPIWSIDDVYLDKETKQQLDTTLTILANKDRLFKEWKIKGNNSEGRAIILNFYGFPGTGKTMTAEAIAQSIGKKVSIVNYAELESKYVGDTPKNITRIFREAKNNDSVIVFDEADSFLGKRLTSVTQAADYGVNVTRSVMLMEIEKFDGIIIFTTNLICNYDEAFKRRILANIEFKLPDLEGRKKIWKTHLPDTLPLSDDVTIDKLATEFENITGADIKDIVLYAAVRCLQNNADYLTLEDFRIAHRYIQNRYVTTTPQNISINSRTITQDEYEKIKSKGEDSYE